MIHDDEPGFHQELRARAFTAWSTASMWHASQTIQALEHARAMAERAERALRAAGMTTGTPSSTPTASPTTIAARTACGTLPRCLTILTTRSARRRKWRPRNNSPPRAHPALEATAPWAFAAGVAALKETPPC